MNLRKKSEKHSHLDLFLILLAALVLIGSLVCIYGMRAFAAPSEQASFAVTLESRGIDALASNGLSVGESLFLADGSVLGNVAAIERFPMTETVFENGIAYTGEWDTDVRCCLRIRAVCRGTRREGVWLLEGKTPLGIGEILTLIGKKSEMDWRIVFLAESAE